MFGKFNTGQGLRLMEVSLEDKLKQLEERVYMLEHPEERKRIRVQNIEEKLKYYSKMMGTETLAALHKEVIDYHTEQLAKYTKGADND